jgi:hypothetical protein
MVFGECPPFPSGRHLGFSLFDPPPRNTGACSLPHQMLDPSRFFEDQTWDLRQDARVHIESIQTKAADGHPIELSPLDVTADTVPK